MLDSVYLLIFSNKHSGVIASMKVIISKYFLRPCYLHEPTAFPLQNMFVWGQSKTFLTRGQIN